MWVSVVTPGICASLELVHSGKSSSHRGGMEDKRLSYMGLHPESS